MHKKNLFTAFMLLILLVAFPVVVGAQDGLDVTVVTDQSCDRVSFTLNISGGSAPFAVEVKYGDTETYEGVLETGGALLLDHAYPSHGEYEYEVKVKDYDGTEVEIEDLLVIDGPTVELGSSPFPPLLTIEGGTASILFTANATGGAGDYTYSWDLDQDGTPDAGLDSATADASYTENGKYVASVTVTDECGLADTDTLTVVVDDPEEDAEEACHPTAQKIAEAVSSIFPDGRADQAYTCEDIFNYFEGGLTGYQLGFGRMWKAYQFTQAIDDLTWEEILDWKLQFSSWGALSQLNRASEFLEDFGIRDLYDLVISEEYTVRDVRNAARSVLRFDAEFEDALARIAEGANAGELGQFYRLVNTLEIDPEELDGYMAEGMSLSELRHAAKLSERTGTEFGEIVEAKSFDYSWGEIGQAYKLADDDASAAEILALGVKEYRAVQREADREQRTEDRNATTAERLAEQLGAGSAEELLALFNGACEGSWSCVRKQLREEQRAQGNSDRDLRTADQLGSQYGLTRDQVMSYFNSCGQDWNCVRSTLRAEFKKPPGKNK